MQPRPEDHPSIRRRVTRSRTRPQAPSLPAGLSNDADQARVTVDELLHQRSSTYEGLLGAPEPFVTFAAPRLEDDDMACSVRLSDAMP